MEVSGDPPQGSHSAILAGGFDWSAADGRAGTCALAVTATVNVGAETGSASGTICGYEVDAGIR